MEGKKVQRGWIPDRSLMKINEQPEVRLCSNCGATMNLETVPPDKDAGTDKVTNNVRKYRCTVCGQGEIIVTVTEQIGITESVHAKVTKENKEDKGQ